MLNPEHIVLPGMEQFSGICAKLETLRDHACHRVERRSDEDAEQPDAVLDRLLVKYLETAVQDVAAICKNGYSSAAVTMARDSIFVARAAIRSSLMQKNLPPLYVRIINREAMMMSLQEGNIDNAAAAACEAAFYGGPVWAGETPDVMQSFNQLTSELTAFLRRPLTALKALFTRSAAAPVKAQTPNDRPSPWNRTR